MTARMRGNMTVNAGEFSTFLKNWLTLAISRYPPDQELGKRISLGRPHLYQYSVRRSKFLRQNCIPVNSAFGFTNMNCHVGTGNVIIMEMNDLPIHVIRKNT